MADSTKAKVKNMQVKRVNRKTGFYYSFLTVVLVFCLIQIGYGAILNVTKIISYQGKTLTLQNLLKKAQLRNNDLKAEQKMITVDNSLEGIARNNLKMAGADEILVIINKRNEKPEKEPFRWKFKFKKKTDDSEDIQHPGNLYIPQEVVEE